MMLNLRYVVLLLCAGTFTAGANQSPYAGEQTREVKSLSTAEVENYLDGKGLGFAKAAELNNYPGPMHVLELAAELDLSAKQREETEKIFVGMRRDARNLGAQLVQKERELDSLFSSGAISESRLDALVQDIGKLQSRIRAAHLRAHIAQKAVLDPAQVSRYTELRGYSSGGSAQQGHHPHAH